MGLKNLSLLALAGTQVWAAGTEKRQSQTKYCPGDTQICFSEFKVPTHDVIYRIAIPDVSAAPFDVLLQIVAPISTTGWAGIAWGGKMTNNPLTVGWSNGKSAVVSSRFATYVCSSSPGTESQLISSSGKTLPGAYAGATYAVLPTSNANATHWQLDVLCRGCSQWSGGSLNPNGVNSLAWAKGTGAVSAASSNTSSFQYHDGRGVVSHDLNAAKIPKGVFDAVAYGLDDQPTASSASSAPVVATSVVTLPRPSSTTVVASASSVASVIPTRLTALPTTSLVYVTTRVTQLPPRPSTSSKPPGPSTTYVVIPPRPSTTTRGIVTVTVTAAPTQTQVTPPWSGGGGPPWGKGKGKGKGKWWGRRDGRLAAEPKE